MTGNDVQGGITFTNTYNADAQLTQISTNWLSPTESGNVVSGIVYNAAGQPVSETLGNGVTEAWAYDAANNQSSYTAGTAYSTSTTWAGNDLAISSTDSVNGNWSYGFDNFGRLSTSSCSSSANVCPGGQSSVGFRYVYDQLANRWQQNLTAGSGPTPLYTFNSYNHITTSGVSYDSAGNVMNDSAHAYTFDAEGRLTKVDGGTTAFFAYNGAGYRVEQGAGSTDSVEYLYDPSGNEVTALVPGTTNLSTSELFDNGRHWVTDNGEAQFLHTDWLGTVRAVTNLAGSVNQTCRNFPFGDGRNCTSSITAYTGISGTIFDSSDNLDHFLYRQYNSTEGRWMTPDPAGWQAVNPAFPQSWNLYAYAMNNPVSDVDPTGLYCVYLKDEGDKVESIDENTDSTECGDNGGYWISGSYGGGSWVNINVNAGTVTGLGYGQYGNAEVSIAGAMNSNGWGAWTQTFTSPGVVSSFQSTNNGSSWVGTFGSNLFSLQNARQAQVDAWNNGYYKCLAKKTAGGVAAPVVTHAAGVAATKAVENGASSIAGAYYHFTDARFTAWGKYSEVLVPNLAPKIATAAEALDVAGWAYFDYELASAINECSGILQ